MLKPLGVHLAPLLLLLLLALLQLVLHLGAPCLLDKNDKINRASGVTVSFLPPSTYLLYFTAYQRLLLDFVYGQVGLDVGLREDVEVDANCELLVVGVLAGGLRKLL